MITSQETSLLAQDIINENIIKYGEPIGHAVCDIKKGEHVHSHNMKTNLLGKSEYIYSPSDNVRKIKETDITFSGYLREKYGFKKIQIIENGTAVDYSEEEATKILSEPEVTAIADVKMGDATATAWGCDLTHGYIDINADYRS